MEVLLDSLGEVDFTTMQASRCFSLKASTIGRKGEKGKKHNEGDGGKGGGIPSVQGLWGKVCVQSKGLLFHISNRLKMIVRRGYSTTYTAR